MAALDVLDRRARATIHPPDSLDRGAARRKVVPFTFAGLNSGNRTDGHRFLGKRNISLSGTENMNQSSRRTLYSFRPEERRKKIETEIRFDRRPQGICSAHEDEAST